MSDDAIRRGLGEAVTMVAPSADRSDGDLAHLRKVG